MLPCPPPTLPAPPAPVQRRAWWYVWPPPPPPPPPRAAAENECDRFFAAPGAALARRYAGGALPSHVLLFDELYAEPRARAVLDARGFARRAAFFHELELTWAAAEGEGRPSGQTSRWPSLRVRRLLLLTRDLGATPRSSGWW